MQTPRYCPSCTTDVEVVDGACGRGHRIPEQSISELRAKVDRAFEHAMAEVAALIGPSEQRPVPARPVSPPPRPPAPQPPGAPNPPPPAAAVPVAPPPRTTVWSELENQIGNPGGTSDPIAAFAPSPRMDWGPDRPVISDVRNLFRRPSGASA